MRQLRVQLPGLTHLNDELCDEDEDLRRKIHELTGIFTVSTKTARVGYEVISRRRSLSIFLMINGQWSMINGQSVLWLAMGVGIMVE